MADFGGFGGGGEWGGPTPSAGPHPPEHLRLSFSGIIGPVALPYEIWSFGLSFALGGASPQDTAAAAFAEDAADRWTTNVAPLLFNQVRLDRVRLARITSDGLTDRNSDGSYAQVDFRPATPVPGSSAVASLPQVALAVSLQSAAPGATGKGRFYLPMPHLSTFDPTIGTMTQAGQTSALTAMTAFVQGLKTDAAAQGFGGPVIASGGSVLRGVAPSLRPVVAVRLGRVYDTMRSRRNAIAEQYASAAIS